LKGLLEENYATDTWMRSLKAVTNPFGDGRAAQRIVKVIEDKLVVTPKSKAALGALV
jgi:hypothetical protein